MRQAFIKYYKKAVLSQDDHAMRAKWIE